MKCTNCGHKHDLNDSIRRLRARDAKLARKNELEVVATSMSLPLHLRMKKDRDKVFQFCASYCAAHEIQFEELAGLSRERALVTPRHVLMWFLSENSHLTLNQLGGLFNRHHATVIHARKSVGNHIRCGDKMVEFSVKTATMKALEVWPPEKAVQA